MKSELKSECSTCSTEKHIVSLRKGNLCELTMRQGTGAPGSLDQIDVLVQKKTKNKIKGGGHEEQVNALGEEKGQILPSMACLFSAGSACQGTQGKGKQSP